MKKFADAFRGIGDGFRHPSILLQWFLGICTVTAGFLLHLEVMEWIAVVICIGMVITAEIFNTCIERLCDVYTKERKEEIRIIKDLAASGVLVVSLAALISAVLILMCHVQGG